MTGSRGRLAGALAALVAVLLLAGCASSRWRFVRNRPDETMETRVTVRSEPPGAEVLLNGKYMGVTPFAVPVRYPCEVRVYERREALPYLHVESKETRTWKGNEFTFRFRLPGHHETERKLTLTGEETRELSVPLSPK